MVSGRRFDWSCVAVSLATYTLASARLNNPSRSISASKWVNVCRVAVETVFIIDINRAIDKFLKAYQLQAMT